LGFPVCYGSPNDVFAASSGFVHLYTLRFKGKEKRGAVVANATVHNREVYSGSSLLADLNFQSVSGLYKNFTRMSPSEFECLINLIGEKISKKDTAFRKAVSVQERLARTLRFLASGDSNVSLQYLFKIFKLAISCIVPEVCEALAEKLKDYIHVRQRLLFLVYVRSLKLDFNPNFYLNTNFTETLLLKNRPYYSTCTCIFSSEDVVTGEMLSVGKL
jgi:hypothetical protein